MTNEATLILRLQDRFSQCKIASGAVLPKGTILKLTDANLGAASSADGDIFMGISLTESDATTTDTTMSYADKGIYDLKCDGVGVTVGDLVKIGGANLISVIGAGEENLAFGRAMQTGAASEVIEVRLGL